MYCYSYNKILSKNQSYLTVINPFTPKSAWFSNIIYIVFYGRESTDFIHNLCQTKFHN